MTEFVILMIYAGVSASIGFLFGKNYSDKCWIRKFNKMIDKYKSKVEHNNKKTN